MLSAKPVELQTAQIVAQNYFNHIKSNQTEQFSSINFKLAHTEMMVDGSPIYFVFNVNQNDGFILISGDDAALPILGYSKEGNYNQNKVHRTFLKWMEGYKQQILFIKANDIKATTKIQNQWKSYAINYFNKAERGSFVDPLVEVKWGQDPYVNDLCPYDNDESKHCVTGCPATAMAQIMAYWNHPIQGSGFHSYDHPKYGTLSVNFGNTTYAWDSMPLLPTESSLAISRLMADCGVAVNMQYTASSSGAFILKNSPTPEACSEYAYSAYFGYDKSIEGLERDDFTDSTWISILKDELDNERPMQYAGFGGGGHTFVCDGYDENDMFHMNWGWSGELDGFYALNALNPGGNGTGAGEGSYNEGQQAIIGIKPDQSRLTSAPIFGLKLAANTTISTNFVENDLPFSVTAEIGYLGSADFSGDIAAILYTLDGVFIDYVDILEDQVFQSGTNKVLTFNTNGITAIPGDYILGIYSSIAGEDDWHLVKKTVFSNPLDLRIYGPANNIKVNAEMILSNNPIEQGRTFSISANILNNGTTDFNGSISADIFESNGDFVMTIDELFGINIPAGQEKRELIFNSLGLTIRPGTYYLALFNSEDTSNYDLISNDFFDNPIPFDVTEPPLVEDIYESNNNKSNAYNFNPIFNADKAIVNTDGSNLHDGDDIDHYKITLAPGYNYEITARVQDEYASNNGINYSCDVYFTYNSGQGDSEHFDDTIPKSFNLNNGGSVNFKVSPFFVGFMGTYRLDINIIRTIIIANKEIANTNSIKVFPNPATNTINLELKNANFNCEKITIQNLLGQIVKSHSISNFSTNALKIDVSDLPNGIYSIQAQDGKLQLNQKFIINR